MKNRLIHIINEEISNYNKSVFTDLPQDLFDKLKLRKFGDDANRSHMKLYKAKDGKHYIISKIINQDVFKVHRLDNLNFPIATAVYDDDNPDYFTGYEHQQSIKVEPMFRRLGLATALTDFAETIYNKPYKPTKLLSEPMQGFVKNRFKEGVADKYAEKEFGIKDPTASQDWRARQAMQPKSTMGEFIGDVIDDDPYNYDDYDTDKGPVEKKLSRVFANPESLSDFQPNVRAVSDDKGNLFVAEVDGSFYHSQMEETVDRSKYYADRYMQWYRIAGGNSFRISTSYGSFQSPLGGDKESQYVEQLRKNHPQYKFAYTPEIRNIEEDVQEIIDEIHDKYTVLLGSGL